MKTPWGKIEKSEKLCRGLTFYHCENGNGFRISKKLNEEIPSRFRNLVRQREEGWYGKTDSCLVVLTFPWLFRVEDCKKAHIDYALKFWQVRLKTEEDWKEIQWWERRWELPSAIKKSAEEEIQKLREIQKS